MTEIAPGMMVECIKTYKAASPKFSFKTGRKYFVKEVKQNTICPVHHMLCGGLEFISMPISNGGGFIACAFKPVGGDKEIEIEQFKSLGFDKMINYFEKVKAHENAHK